MRIGIIAGVALGLLGSVAAKADDQPAGGGAAAHYNLLGPSMCSQWPKSGSITSATKAVPLNWALGYLGAEAGDDRLALLDLATPDAVDHFLTSYCAKHPEQNLPLAVKVLAATLEAELPPTKVASAPPEPPMFVPPTAVPKETSTSTKAAPGKKAVAKKKPAAKPAASGN